MSTDSSIDLPIELPPGWTAEVSEMYGTIITAVDSTGQKVGYVTVSEKVRHFELGITIPRRLQNGAEPAGRAWKVSLYKAAVASLRNALN